MVIHKKQFGWFKSRFNETGRVGTLSMVSISVGAISYEAK
jgi:hypothetical protein